MCKLFQPFCLVPEAAVSLFTGKRITDVDDSSPSDCELSCRGWAGNNTYVMTIWTTCVDHAADLAVRLLE